MKKFVAGFFLCCLVLASRSQNFDINTLKKINVNRNKNLDKPFLLITNSNNYVNFGTAGGFTITGLLKKNKELTKQGLLLFSTQFTALVFTQGLKQVIQRDRPFKQYSFIDPYLKELEYSMPSGHTSSAFANAAAISHFFPKWYVVAPAFTYASLVGYSRMHLGVHYPTDVLAGAALGVGSFYLTNWAWNKLFLKGTSPKKG
jgi:membrane-associated phospholipid phosphatase